jgi:TonB family protein
MKLRSTLKASPVVILCAVVVGLAVTALVQARARARAAEAMAASAKNFLGALTPDQRTKATFKFDDAERLNWHIIPRPRKGLAIKEMDAKQRDLAHALIKTGLSQRGHQKAHDIMNKLELVLRAMEKDPVRRDPENYLFSVFGTPDAKGTWGWRVEGHHLSLNFTVVNGKMTATSPMAFATNPAEVREGEFKGLRVLSGEEDHARALLKALDEKQRAVAVYEPKAPPDIFTLAKNDISPLTPPGLKASEMTSAQFAMLEKLVNEYAANVAPELAAERMKQFKSAKRDQITFAWAGGMERGEGHYYRVQTPAFLIEYDNTQNNNNHIHSVWRDFKSDFGRDWLREHYKSTPHTSSNADPAKSGAAGIGTGGGLLPVTPGLRPVITYKEKASYTIVARNNGVQGAVLLSAIFTADGKVTGIRVIRGLPDGLTEKAIEAAQKIRFKPAMKDGQPVSVRMTLEYNFALGL